MTVEQSSGFLANGALGSGLESASKRQHLGPSNGLSQPINAKEHCQHGSRGQLSPERAEEVNALQPASTGPHPDVHIQLVHSEPYIAAQKGRPTDEPQLDASRGGDTRYLGSQPNGANIRRYQVDVPLSQQNETEDSQERAETGPDITVTRPDTRSSGDQKTLAALDGTESVVSITTNKIIDNGDSQQLESTRDEKAGLLSKDEAEQITQSISRMGGAVEANDQAARDSDSLSLDIPDTELPDTDLCLRLREAMVHRVDGEERLQFLPIRTLDNLLTEEQVKQTLRSAFHPGSNPERLRQIEKMATYICKTHKLEDGDLLYPSQKFTSSRRIFAILVLIEKIPMIEHFIKAGLIDKDLPLRKEVKNGCSRLYSGSKDGRPLGFFDQPKCSPIVADNFFDWQWKMLSPYFGKHKGSKGRVSHYQLQDHIILPFTRNDERTEAGTPGGFGVVWQVAIHPDHHDFENFATKDADGETTFAVKRLSTTKYEEFRDEVHALERFSNKSNAHLIRLLATYKHKGHYYLLFPWANGNLRDYWKRHPNPSLTHSRGLWVVEQCLGLAQALNKIHNWQDSQNDSVEADRLNVTTSSRETRRYGRHGDIKPENILWFKDEPDNDTTGVLKISDFGLTRFNSQHSASRQPRRGFSVSYTYRAPEIELEEGYMTRSYDIWTLGCLYIEFVIWLLMGSCAVVHLFPHDRTLVEPGEDIELEWKEDTFFSLFKDQSGKRYAKVRNAVDQWISFLHKQPKCSSLVHDFLDLIRKEMLQEDPGKRAQIGTVVNRLSVIVKKAAVPEYVHEGCLQNCVDTLQTIDCQGLGLLAQSLDASSVPSTFRNCDGKGPSCPNVDIPQIIHRPRTKSRSSSRTSVGSLRMRSVRNKLDGVTASHYVSQVGSERNPSGGSRRHRHSSSVDDSKPIDPLRPLSPLGRSSWSESMEAPASPGSPGSQTPTSPRDEKTNYFSDRVRRPSGGDHRQQQAEKAVSGVAEIPTSSSKPDGGAVTTTQGEGKELKNESISHRPHVEEEHSAKGSDGQAHKPHDDEHATSKEGRYLGGDARSSEAQADPTEGIPHKTEVNRPPASTSGQGRTGQNGHAVPPGKEKIKTGCWQTFKSWFR